MYVLYSGEIDIKHSPVGVVIETIYKTCMINLAIAPMISRLQAVLHVEIDLVHHRIVCILSPIPMLSKHDK